jgi:hypothetical protein
MGGVSRRHIQEMETNADKMYIDQAMKEPDKPEFERAMVKEVETHTKEIGSLSANVMYQKE